MNPIVRSLAFVLLAAYAITTPGWADDLTVVSDLTVRGKTSTSTAYLTETAMRTSDGRNDVIIDFGGERMVTIDHKKKTWSETTFAAMRSKMKEVESLLEDNPMAASLLGGSVDASVEKLGSTREIAGHTCHDYLVTMGAKMRYEVCAAPSIKPPIDYFEARKMAGLMLGPMAARMNKLYDALSELDGFPLVTEMSLRMMGMNMDTRQVATAVTSSVPGDAFDIPSNYKKKKSAF